MGAYEWAHSKPLDFAGQMAWACGPLLKARWLMLQHMSVEQTELKDAAMNSTNRTDRILAAACLSGTALVFAGVGYGFYGAPGPVGIGGLWKEPWFLITLADLYLGIAVALGFLWTRPGNHWIKAAWTILFVIGGHPAVAAWIGLWLLRGKDQSPEEPKGSPGT